MSSDDNSPFTGFLNRHDQDAWWAVIDELGPAMHAVDRDATRIWFSFWPLWLRGLLREAAANPKLLEELEVKGNPDLAEQIDSSHSFVYGHRYWGSIKDAIVRQAAVETPPESLDLADQVRVVAASVAAAAKVDASLLIGITAIGFMTLQQVGREALAAAEGKLHISDWARKKSPKAVLADRARNGGGGLLGYLKGLKKEYTITFDEAHRSANFKLIEGVHLTQASMMDQANHPYANARCVAGDGPIPTECRSAACGLCWVGVLGGNDRLSAVQPLERRRLARFGYVETQAVRPLIRLACKAHAHGNATIVIAPWNGIAGNYLAGKKTAIGGLASSEEDEAVAQPRRH